MSTYSDIYGNVEIGGMEIPIVGEAEIIYENRDFSHEFGVERDGSFEVESVNDIHVDGDTRELVVDMMHRLSHTNHNRRFKKSVRRRVNKINSYVAGLDYEAFSKDEIERAISDADTQSEPDDSMDGDFDSAMASAGLGTDEDYGGGCENY